MSLNSLGPAFEGMPSARMIHSQSTPQVDGLNSSATNHSRGGKKLAVRLQLLDDAMTMFQVQVKSFRRITAMQPSDIW